MTTQEIQDNNRLIAEFMGAKILSPNTKHSMIQYPLTVNTRTIGQHKETYKKIIHSKNLEYHSDWNWLMPVVEKIESLGYWTEIFGGASAIVRIGRVRDPESIVNRSGMMENKPQNLYKAVVQFILWQNSQNVQPTVNN